MKDKQKGISKEKSRVTDIGIFGRGTNMVTSIFSYNKREKGTKGVKE